MSEGYPYFRFPHEYYSMGFAKELSNFSLSIYGCLLHHKNNKTGDCYPSEATIAKECGIVRNTVRKHIKPLIDFKLISKKKKQSNKGNWVFNYTFHPPNKWKKLINNICAPYEHIDCPDVHTVTDQCSPDAMSDVHDMHTNKKKLTKRNNNEKTVVNDFYMFGTDDYENELDTSILPLEDDSQPCLGNQAPRLKRETTPESMRFAEKARQEIKTDDDRRKYDIATHDDVKEVLKRFKENF